MWRKMKIQFEDPQTSKVHVATGFQLLPQLNGGGRLAIHCQRNEQVPHVDTHRMPQSVTDSVICRRTFQILLNRWFGVPQQQLLLVFVFFLLWSAGRTWTPPVKNSLIITVWWFPQQPSVPVLSGRHAGRLFHYFHLCSGNSSWYPSQL